MLPEATRLHALIRTGHFPKLAIAVSCGIALLAIAGLTLIRDPNSAARPNPDRGAEIFATAFKPAQGLGPLFNGSSCLDCHNTPSAGGAGPNGLSSVLRVGRLSETGFDAMLGRGGPVARAHSISELGVSCPLAPGVPPGANVTSVRNAPALFGDGQLDAIPDAVILAGAVARGDGILGRPDLVAGRVGRFGWKADTPTLTQFVGEAFRNELGITNPIAPVDLVPAGVCGGESDHPKADASMVADVVAFINGLPAPVPNVGGDPTVFNQIGCGACHTPSLDGKPVYSDMLLHDMGRALNDGVVQAGATGRDWRTTPLWGLSHRTRFLHDGRARTLEAAILAHGGEAEAVVQRFRSLDSIDRASLLAFLNTL